ncbi:MAG: hypothetical protein GDA50_05770 [Alphaproteobacteria bacterium GM202ARS2]|nr:hypothetical protein [Alphaproteobacteria bacterium GM202ARS2]
MKAQDYAREGENIAEGISSIIDSNFKDQEWNKTFARVLQAQLKQARKIGGELRLRLYGSNEKENKEAQYDIQSMANQLIPADWVNKSNECGTIHTRRIRGRQWHRFIRQNSTIKVDDLQNPINVTAGDSLIFTAENEIYDTMHEFVHRLQNVFPDIQEMFQSIHDQRTAHEDIDYLYHDGHEVGKKDDYINAYFGRVYPHGGALELWPMCCQSIMGHLLDDLYCQRFFLEKDPELAYITIGVLFCFEG